jgi:hypothetical protein
MTLSDHKLIRLLESLALPASDYVVTGSGPLLAHGLKNDIHDIDVLARGRAWEMATRLRRPRRSQSGLGLRVVLFGGDIEIFDHWVGGVDDVDAMIDSADFVDGLPFLSLADTMRWKHGLGRAKDLADIALIERHLSVPVR